MRVHLALKRQHLNDTSRDLFLNQGDTVSIAPFNERGIECKSSGPTRSTETPRVAEGYPVITEDVSTRFRAAMRRLAASVAIVVARGDDGPVGMAATSITSLTIDPPAVLVCVNRTASLHALLVPTAPLSVNLLSQAQRHISAAFGGGVPRDQRFSVGDWRMAADQLPELAGSQAHLRCVIDAMLAYGTHSIVIARVLDAKLGEASPPLIYHDGAYL